MDGGAWQVLRSLPAWRAAVEEDRWVCDRHELQWLARPYQWALVLDSLRAAAGT